MTELALFPLQIVVFPGEEAPLHIFEPRYRQLVRDISDSGDPFGIVLSKRTPRQGEEEWHEVGCSVRMESAEAFPDGRFNITCRGERRFRVLRRLGERPYWTAEVEWIADADEREEADAEEGAEATAELYREHLALSLALENCWQRRYRLPRRPSRLVNHIGSRIEAPPTVKQEVLKAETALEQLRLLARMLRSANRTMEGRVELHRRQHWHGLGAAN